MEPTKININNCPHRYKSEDPNRKCYWACKLRGEANINNYNDCVGDESGCTMLKENTIFSRELLR